MYSAFHDCIATLLKCAVLLMCLLCFCLTSSFAQEDQRIAEDRARAFSLVEQGNYIGALPLLEKLAKVQPDNVDVNEKLAYALVAQTTTAKNAQEKAQLLKRARAIAVRFSEKGNSTELLSRLLEIIPPDGIIEEKSAKTTPGQAALEEGEAAFTRGDVKGALAGYEKAEKLDPRLYEAPLFTGDVYFQMKEIDKAGQAYARAIAIDPDRETAYRYWGNVLAQSGKMEEAREKLIEAIVAEPYNRITWNFLVGWAQKNNAQLGHPKVVIPTSVEKQADKDGKNQTNITLDINSLAKKDGSGGWMFYGITRSLWVNEKFLKEFPSEKTYRHSLREETDALRGVIEAARNELKENKGTIQIEPTLANLFLLDKEGLLEAFILFAKPDQGIAQDYVAYRKANRDTLRKYLTTVVLNGGKIGK